MEHGEHLLGKWSGAYVSERRCDTLPSHFLDCHHSFNFTQLPLFTFDSSFLMVVFSFLPLKLLAPFLWLFRRLTPTPSSSNSIVFSLLSLLAKAYSMTKKGQYCCKHLPYFVHLGMMKRLLCLWSLRQQNCPAVKLNLLFLPVWNQFFLWGQCGGNVPEYR